MLNHDAEENANSTYKSDGSASVGVPPGIANTPPLNNHGRDGHHGDRTIPPSFTVRRIGFRSRRRTSAGASHSAGAFARCFSSMEGERSWRHQAPSPHRMQPQRYESYGAFGGAPVLSFRLHSLRTPLFTASKGMPPANLGSAAADSPLRSPAAPAPVGAGSTGNAVGSILATPSRPHQAVPAAFFGVATASAPAPRDAARLVQAAAASLLHLAAGGRQSLSASARSNASAAAPAWALLCEDFSAARAAASAAAADSISDRPDHAAFARQPLRRQGPPAPYQKSRTGSVHLHRGPPSSRPTVAAMPIPALLKSPPAGLKGNGTQRANGRAAGLPDGSLAAGSSSGLNGRKDG